MSRAYFLMMIGFVMCAGCSDGDRYMIAKGENGIVYRTDRKTGETVMIRGTTMRPVTEYQPPKPPQKARDLLVGELADITGRGGVGVSPDSFSGTIYNGRKDLDLRTITIAIEHLNHNGGKYSREYKYEFGTGKGQPLATSSFYITIVRGDEPKDYVYPWRIVGATGVSRE